jgi:hypothetical protein
MLDSVPLPFQAILWPLVGGGLVLALNRLLPGWVRRLVAMAAAFASLVVLWSLKAAAIERAEILWEPLNFFRMSLTLSPDGLSLLIGIALAGATAAMALGIRGQEPRQSAWHGLILLVSAGCLAVVMAANLLALAAGSALIDLALIFLVLRSSIRSEGTGRMPLSLVVPGVVSTLLLFLGALQMDAQLGHGSLLSQNLSEEALGVIGVAGALRALVFPFHARKLRVPETVAALLLPIGAGGYLLARVQALAPVLSSRPWVMAVAVIGLLAGGLLAWSGSARSTARVSGSHLPGTWWTGVLIYQAAYVLAFVLLLAGGTPWPIVGLVLVLAILAIWWDTTLDVQVPSSRGLEWLRVRIGPWWDRVWSDTTERLRVPGWWRGSQLGRYAAVLLPATALASLAGMPLTLGARGRWPYYAAWLKRGDPSLLVILVSDTLLVAGLWAALISIWEQNSEHRPRPAALVSMIALTVSTVLLGLAPGILSEGLDLEAVETAGVSAWGLGLLYLLPWLLGVWLARFRGLQQRHLGRIWDAVSLDWLYRGAGWIGQRLVDIAHWLSQVGEGEGWWGWALIILALGVILFTVQ